ncbi:unnamed protein product [Rotaria sp. Silwood1]|nr:unnamed protein product [Rotaria sp. Silwood1]
MLEKNQSSDRKALLNASSKLSIDDGDDDNRGKKQLSVNSFFDWRRYFNRSTDDKNYIKLDDDIQHNDKDGVVGVFQLFRFSNCLDIALMFTTICLIAMHTVAMLASLVLFSQLMGIFAIESFGDICEQQHKSSRDPMKNDNTSSQVAEFATFNSTSLHKLRHGSETNFSLGLTVLTPSFRGTVMTKIHWLLKSLQLAANEAMNHSIAASISAADTFFDLFDRIPAIDNTSTAGQELVDFHGEIKFDQVKFIYPTRPTSIVLNQFQLNIKPGQRVALVGTSGSGKSTTIQLLERFYDVTSGRILLDDVDIRRINLHWVRSQFGLVSQEPILFDLTIAENITYGLENVSMEDIINAATKANIHQFIDHLPQGYETKVGTKGSFLSGGEKQRIAIARILIRRPKVLLLDEATSAMDSYNEQIIQKALEQAQTDDPSRTSLIIAHRLSTIRSCDLICVLEKGHIVESGTHTELIQRYGTYYKMLAQNNLQ